MENSLLPFMLDDTHKLHPLYNEVRASMLGAVGSVDLAETVRKKLIGLGGDDKEYMQCCLRMMIILVSFNDFLANNSPARCVSDNLEALSALLDINDEEKKAFRLFSQGPLRATEKEPLPYMLSYESLSDRNVDSSFAYFMANLTAVTVGAPRNSNHMYRRFFDIGSGANSCCPGSAFGNRNNWDCGFKIYGEEYLDQCRPPCMGNKKEYKYLLDALTWTSYCLALLLDADKNVPIAHRMPHFLNYVHEVPSKYEGDINRTRYYVMERGATFFNRFITNEEFSVKKNINTTKLVNQVLMGIFDASTGFGKPSSRNDILKTGVYKDVDECVRYENKIQSILEDVLGNFAEEK